MSEEVTLDEFADSEKMNEEESQELFGLGEIPSDWDIKSLSDTAEIIPGNSPPSSTYNDKGDGLPFFQGNSNFAHFHPEADTWCSEPRKEAQPNDVLISIRAPVGDLNIADTKSCIGRGLAAIRPKSLNGLYLYYNLGERKIWLSRLATGSTFKAINKSDLQLLDVPTPPLPEQRKIATVLYTVDRAIEKTSELIEQLGRVKQGLRQNILTSGITEDGKVRASPESEPEQYTDARQWTVPNSWELKELSDICSIQVGYAFKSDWYQEEGNVRVLRGANVGYGEPDWSETYFLEPERVSEYEEYLLNEGDLIIGMDRPYTNSGFKISRLSETDVPSLLVQRVGRFVPEGCDPDYLHVVLSDWRYQKQVLRRAQGMDIPHISQTDILSPKIPLPSLDEQKRIADQYSSILERIDCEENLLREYKTLKQGLMQDLLSGTVRTTDTNIEVPEEIAQYG